MAGSTIEYIHCLLALHADKSALDKLPFSIYWKNLDGIYIWRSQTAAEVMVKQGFSATTDQSAIMGKSDHDIFTKALTERFHDNDIQVVNTKRSQTFIEPLDDAISDQGVNLSIKQPLLYQHGDLRGIMGCTLELPVDMFSEFNLSHWQKVTTEQQLKEHLQVV